MDVNLRRRRRRRIKRCLLARSVRWKLEFAERVDDSRVGFVDVSLREGRVSTFDSVGGQVHAIVQKGFFKQTGLEDASHEEDGESRDGMEVVCGSRIGKVSVLEYRYVCNENIWVDSVLYHFTRLYVAGAEMGITPDFCDQVPLSDDAVGVDVAVACDVGTNPIHVLEVETGFDVVQHIFNRKILFEKVKVQTTLFHVVDFDAVVFGMACDYSVGNWVHCTALQPTTLFPLGLSTRLLQTKSEVRFFSNLN